MDLERQRRKQKIVSQIVQNQRRLIHEAEYPTTHALPAAQMATPDWADEHLFTIKRHAAQALRQLQEGRVAADNADDGADVVREASPQVNSVGRREHVTHVIHAGQTMVC
eukprot:jgi/Chlat1/9022/Chrsp94S08351